MHSKHGGVAPVIIGADADIDAAVPALAKGGALPCRASVCIGAKNFLFMSRL